MAKQLDDFDFRMRQCNADWSAWLDGSIWELTKGEDFDCEARTFVTRAHSNARSKKRKVKTRVLDGGMRVVLQAIPREQADSPVPHASR